MDRKAFGNKLRELRERKKLKVTFVIEELKKYGQDITAKALYSYENGDRAASADMLLALCQIYNCFDILETFTDIEPDYSVLSDAEWEMIEKYRLLDKHGKKMVDFTINEEYARVNPTPRASKELTIDERVADYRRQLELEEQTQGKSKASRKEA